MTIGGPNAWYSMETAPTWEWVECRWRGNDDFKIVAMRESRGSIELWRERESKRVLRADELPDLWRPLQNRG